MSSPSSSRRGLLRAAVAGGVGALALRSERVARAQAFGEAPGASQQAKLLPAGVAATSILECYLYGGLSPWETFYAVEQYGRPDDPEPALRNSQIYAFHNPTNDKLGEALQLCGVGPETPLFTPFALDASGAQVNLGPYVAPLLARPDVIARMRVVVNRHDLEPHEAAIPFAVCGKRLGSPTLASLGAHIQRHFVEREGGTRLVPHSYVFSTKSLPIENVRATVATGLHPGSSRPLLIKVDSGERLAELLGRPSLGSASSKDGHDALVRAYADSYREQLRFGGQGDPVRSARLRELDLAAASVQGAPAVASLLPVELFKPFQGARCGVDNLDLPSMSLRLAAHLLTHPTTPARYCCFVDPGLISADAGGGYDTHIEAPLTQARNIGHTLQNLLERINAPGEGDPGKIDLDRTMIVLNMEFGRSPRPQGALGRNHWPYGYVQVYLGGPITEQQRGVHGAIGPDGRASVYTTPPENRIACLLALGIWPFSADSFGVSDVRGASGEIDAVERVSAAVLGRPV